MEIRNIAIIAHVDHGKTTLTDALMRQTGMSEAGDSMDSDTLEQERGITIYSKNTSVYYKDTKINIVDTPGHADFGSEVERVLRSIDSVLLVVDAQEGPMPQTKFVLKKSLDLGLKPIVVLNKIDKPAARPDIVQEMVYELFLDLGASDEQLDFTTLYAIAREGIAKANLGDDSKDLTPLLNTILEKVPVASKEEAKNKPLRVQPFNLAYDNFLGRLAIGRIYEGEIKDASAVVIKDTKGKTREGKITKLFTFEGLKRKEVRSADAGDIVMIAGLPDIFIGETICEDAEQEALPAINIDEPTISATFGEVMCSTYKAFGAQGIVTSGAGRDIDQVEASVSAGHRDLGDMGPAGEVLRRLKQDGCAGDRLRIARRPAHFGQKCHLPLAQHLHVKRHISQQMAWISQGQLGHQPRLISPAPDPHLAHKGFVKLVYLRNLGFQPPLPRLAGQEIHNPGNIQILRAAGATGLAGGAQPRCL